MATQQEKSLKNPNYGHKTRFFSKIPEDLELLKQVPESSHQTGSFGVPQHIRTLILSQSAFPRSVVHIGPKWTALVILSTLVCSGLYGSSWGH